MSFVPLNITDDDSVELVLAHIDNAMQFGEDAEPKELTDPSDRDADGDTGSIEVDSY